MADEVVQLARAAGVRAVAIQAERRRKCRRCGELIEEAVAQMGRSTSW